MIGAARSPVRGTRPSARAAHTRHTLHVADSRRTASVGARRGQARPRQGSSSAGSARRRRRVFGPSGEPRRHRLERRRAAHAHGGAAAQASDGSIRHVRRFSDLGFQLGQVAHRGSIQVRARRWQRQSLGSDVELLARWDAALTQTAKASPAERAFSGVAARTMRQCGHQVREFKSHFRFRGFGTVYQLWYKS